MSGLLAKLTLWMKKITGLGKRLDFQEFLNRGFLIGVGVATLQNSNLIEHKINLLLEFHESKIEPLLTKH
jgi:hypothetical protein